MKTFLFVAASFLLSLSAIGQQKADDFIKVSTEKHDFGKIKQNVPVSTFFQITNTSDKPVVIENAWGSCGCTTPEVPKEPIAPKSTVKLKVNYNAASMNRFEKDVYIKLAGVSEAKVVKITGEVLSPAAYDTYAKQKRATNAPAPKAKG
ncbi:MAG TPA: DUF1573 domain-containing protein [Chitinophagaceae bacterium]|jgi:hypothetical protein|nr:DUF1573 domain-containing protein [Chitinophagaceae bacterium]